MSVIHRSPVVDGQCSCQVDVQWHTTSPLLSSRLCDEYANPKENSTMSDTTTSPTDHMPPTMRPRVDRPCPTWCNMPAGHGWDSADRDAETDTIYRGHGSAPFGEGGHVWLWLEEQAEVPAGLGEDEHGFWDGTLLGEPGPSSVAPGRSTISIDREDDMTITEARALAAALVEAADFLEGQS